MLLKKHVGFAVDDAGAVAAVPIPSIEWPLWRASEKGERLPALKHFLIEWSAE